MTRWKYYKLTITTLKVLGALVSYQLVGLLLAYLNPTIKQGIATLILIPTIPTIVFGSYYIFKEVGKL